MVQCAIAGCTQEGISQCGKCKKRFYCTADCQQKDWPEHKKQCKRPNASPTPGPTPTMSPFGQMFNMFSGSSTPMSSNAVFFDPMFGYTADKPELVYADLVNAYRLLRLGSHSTASAVPPTVQNMEFSEWMERITRSGVLPKWWDADVNGAGIDTYSHEDAWGRLDRVVSRDEICDSLVKRARVMSLEMIIERIVTNA
ncbi:hypothetical protein C8R43DRAFT_516496 [Mycena crocata]|nr:hypothetical protein C8R43DRAFT_516496 [Mycena crocata]